jgi:WD40 repeat protein
MCFMKKGKFLKVTPPRVLMSVCFMPKDDVVYVGSGDGRILVFRYPGECFTAQQMHDSESTVMTLCAQKDGKHLWSGGSDHMLYQSSVKDFKLTKLRSYDFSAEGNGRMEVIGAADDGANDNFSHVMLTAFFFIFLFIFYFHE